MPTSGPLPLGDHVGRTYADKLQRFARFAAPEIERVIDSLAIGSGDRVLDAGCGTGLTTEWLTRRTGSEGVVVELDLSAPHCKVARALLQQARVVNGDLQRAPLKEAAFDLVWALNTVNHLDSLDTGCRRLSELLRPGGRLVAVQSHFLPEMNFAWDVRLERAVTDACHQYYRHKYHLNVVDTSATRRLVGAMRDSRLRDVRASTSVIERQQPLCDADRDYFLHAVFRGYWGPKLQPYLTPGDWKQLQRFCDPESRDYCLDRPDFHHVQTLTAVTGVVPGATERVGEAPRSDTITGTDS